VSNKITLKTKTLLDATSKAAMWVTKKSPIQALQCVRFTRTGNKLELSATDGSSTDISLYLEVDGEGDDFDFCIPADRLLPKLQILAKSEQDITLTFGKTVSLTSGSHYSRINTIGTEYFPELQRKPEYFSATKDVLSDDLIDAISKTLASADPNSPYPALEGIYINGKDVVSADGTKIALYTDVSFMDGDILVHADSFSKIAKAISGTQNIAMIRDDKRLVVVWGGGISTATIIGYDFPDYKAIIPEGYETEFSLDRQELLDAIGLASSDAVDSNNLVVIDAGSDAVIIHSESSIGDHTSEMKPLTFSGPQKRFGISLKYLKDALAKIKKNNIEFGVNATNGLIVLHDGDIYKYGIMPMYVKE